MESLNTQPVNALNQDLRKRADTTSPVNFAEKYKVESSTGFNAKSLVTTVKLQLEEKTHGDYILKN